MSSKHSPTEQPTPPKPPVSVKGREDGLRIVVGEAEPAVLERSLRTQLERKAGQFFAGAPVVLEMPGASLDLSLVARLGKVVEQAGMCVATVVSSPRASEARGRERERKPMPAAHGLASGGMLVTGTVRGGQRLVSDGTVVVMGDVNPGGEVRAGGSVIVWGRLRGFVEAGQAGPEGPSTAVVCALDLAPTQLRIGAALARSPEDPDRVPLPEVARESEGRIVVEAWR